MLSLGGSCSSICVILTSGTISRIPPSDQDLFRSQPNHPDWAWEDRSIGLQIPFNLTQTRKILPSYTIIIHNFYCNINNLKIIGK